MRRLTKGRPSRQNPRIFSVETFFASLQPRPSRAVLFAFEASLPLVERVVIPALGADTVDEIDIAIDETDYAQSRFDGGAVAAAGIRYQVHSIRLAGGARFHPKLAFLPYADGF